MVRDRALGRTCPRESVGRLRPRCILDSCSTLERRCRPSRDYRYDPLLPSESIAAVLNLLETHPVVWCMLKVKYRHVRYGYAETGI